MAQILFGQSYYLEFDRKLLAAMEPYPPLGTLYAASCLRARGYDVAVFDAMLARSESEWTAALDLHRPQYAVLYEDNFNYLSKMCLLRMRHAAFAMAAAAKERGCTVVVAGPDAVDHVSDYLARGADYVIVGEGEATLAELMDAVTGRTKVDEPIRGLAYRDESGALVRSPARDFRDLDALDLPAWDLVDIDHYRELWLRHHGYFSMNVATTRGCPYHCNWCAKPIYGQRYNTRSPENVVAELLALKRDYSPDHIAFADDIFGLRPGWIERFADLVQSQQIKTPYKCLLRADLVTSPTAQALARSGCDIVWMGAESGSQRILDAMEKGTRVEQIRAATGLLKRVGVRVGFFLQFGYRGENRADIGKTLALVRECDPDDIGISVSYPLPGTRFYDLVRAEMGDKQNWSDSDDLAMLYRGTYSSTFYRVLYKVVHKEFRARKALQKLWRRGGDRRFGAFARLIFECGTLFLARIQLQALAFVTGRRAPATPVGNSNASIQTQGD
ncbi:MAG: B12-binding domain-containing radical SAM protein [Chloroflexi bacterium]|nr:B12-binding domain-containing radical SAM protein [Chloroflexota bacterium]